MWKSRVIAIVVMIFSGYGLYFSARLFYAETLVEQGTVPSVEHALRITPGRADLHERLARAIPERAVSELQEALRLNPREAGWWQELAVQQELAGDEASAEKSLLEGAKVSRYYLPRWALADFYFRHDNKGQFLHWAREALLMSPGDPTSLFQMSHSLGVSDQELRNIVPARPIILSAFLSWLEQNQANTINLSTVVTELLASDETKQYSWAALGAASWLFQHGQAGEAAGVWNQMVQKGVAPVPERLDAAAGHSLLDGEMRYLPLNGAASSAGAVFGWQVAGPPVDGVSLIPSHGEPGVLIEANGKEPDRVELLGQNVVLVPGQRYRLTAEYEVQGAGEVKGDALWWEVVGSGQGVAAPAAASLAKGMMSLRGSGAGSPFQLEFGVPATTAATATTGARVTLRVERPLGAVLLEGAVHVGRVGLGLVR